MTTEEIGAEAGDWLIDPFGGPLPIDRERDGDEWQYRMSGLVQARAGGGGFSAKYPGEGLPPHMEFSLTDADLKSRMWAIPVEHGIYVLIALSGEATTDQVEPWADAAFQAQREVGNEHAPIAWTALVGPDPGGVAESPAKTIAEELQIGSVRLIPSGQAMTEGVPARASLSQLNIHVSEPIRVEGASKGYDWRQASGRAFDELHVLCGLLSVALDQCWVVRAAPQPSEWGKFEVPPTVNLPVGVPESGASQAATKVAMPDWAHPGFHRAETDRRFRNRLAGFQEGMSARSDHPSLAAVAFVAVIETIGALIVPTERCPACGMQTGSGKAFRRALRLVLPEAEAEPLDKAYGVRSKTAHEGQLHGDETRFGMFTGPTFWTVDPVWVFQWQQLWKLRRVARELLQMELRGDLPPRDEA